MARYDLPNRPADVRRIPLGPDAELHLRLVPDARRQELPALDARLFRRSPQDVSAEGFCPTAAGWQLPARHLSALIAHLETLRRQAAEHALWAPPGDG